MPFVDAQTSCPACKKFVPLSASNCAECGAAMPVDAFTPFTRPDGSRGIVDAETLRFFRSHARPKPSSAQLDPIFRRATRIEIRGLSGELRTTLTAPEDISDLRSALDVTGGQGHLMSPPGYLLDLYAGDDHLASIALVSYCLLRCDFWSADGSISDIPKLVQFMTKHGIPDLAEQFECDRAQIEQEQCWKHLWIEATPEVLRACVAHIDPWESPHDLKACRALMEASFPSPGNQVAVLLDWLSQGGVHWEGCLIEETIVYELLDVYSMNAFIAALAEAPPTRAAGLVRFVQWGTDHQHWARNLPHHFRELLLAQMEDHPDERARALARQLFANAPPTTD